MVHKDGVSVLVYGKGVVSRSLFSVHIPGGQQRIRALRPVLNVQKVLSSLCAAHADGIFRAGSRYRIAQEDVPILLQNCGAFVYTIPDSLPSIFGTGQTGSSGGHNPGLLFADFGNKQVCAASLIRGGGLSCPDHVRLAVYLILKVGHVQTEGFPQRIQAVRYVRGLVHPVIRPLGLLVCACQGRLIGVLISGQNQGMTVDSE